MALVFRFEDSSGVERLDLNDPSGFEVARGLDLGTASVVHTFLSQPPYDGATLAASWRPLATMFVPLILHEQASMAAMKTLWDALVTELDRDTNVIRFQPEGAASASLYDTYRADIPTKYRGQAAPFIGGDLLQDVELVPLVILRHPEPRGAGHI